MIKGEIEHGAQVLDVENEKSALVSDSEDDVEHSLLGVIKTEDTAQQPGSHLRDRASERMSLLTENIVETNRTSLKHRVLHSEFRHSLLNESTHTSRLGYSGEIALHVRHEARDSRLAESLGHDLKCDRLSGAGGSGHKTVPVRHLSDDGNRIF